MKFKKIYLEITNICNLSCSFCPKFKRKQEYISIKQFKLLLSKLKGYSKYLYFHLMGEPLMHPKINELIDYAAQDFYINITTNGYLIKRIENNKNIRQINISLHSYDPKYHQSLEKYLENICLTCDKLQLNNTIINFRLWTNTEYKKKIIKYLNDYYNCDIKLEKGFKIKENVFIDEDQEFTWPNLNNTYYSNKGKCLGLKTHIGILVDGSVVPCCLDSEGIINLGNIYKDDLDKILSNKRSTAIIKGFQNNLKIEELCKHCSFYKK